MCRPKHIFFQWLGGVGTWICIDPNGQFSYCSVGEGELSYSRIYRNIWGSGNCDIYGPKHLVFQLSRGMGLLICNDPNIQFFNFLEEGTSYMYGPKHLVFQLFRKGGTWIYLDLSIQFSIVRQSGNPNFAMYGPSHLVVQLLGGVETWICMDRDIQFINCSVGGGEKLDIGHANLSKHLAFQLFRGVETWICMAPNIQFFN